MLIEKGEKSILVISGDNSKREREDFLKTLVEIENGFVVLSTGKFIGEGFDQSKFDTLFITSPFRWRGTLSQYVGRLHRARVDKVSVEVVDFIDIKVGVFSSMYYERLSGYKKEKYSLLSDKDYYQKQIFSVYEYEEKFISDLKKAVTEIIFVINNYDLSRVVSLLDEYKDKCTIYTSLDNISNYKINCTNFKTNLVVIDKRIIWYGGINPFVVFQFSSDIMRIDDKAVADDLVKEICCKK